MPIPLHLLVAAAKAAKDPNTIRTIKAVYDLGAKAVERRQKRAAVPKPVANKAARDSKASPAPASKTGSGEARKSAGKGAIRTAIEKKLQFRKGRSGDLIRFVHTDSDGLKTTRTVGNWSSDGRVLSGYCLNRKAERAFRLSEISDYEELL